MEEERRTELKSNYLSDLEKVILTQIGREGKGSVWILQ